MAYTKGVYEIDATTGKAAIYLVDPLNTEDRAPFTDPLNNLTRLLWHSDLDYLEVFYDQTQNLSLPARGSNVNTSADYAFANHSLGSVPYGGMIVGAIQLDGAQTVQQNGSSKRTLECILTTTGVTVRERAVTVSGGSLAAITPPVRVILFRVAPVLDAANSFDINPETGLVHFGFGKFSTAGNAKLKITAGTPIWRLSAIGRTIDSSGITLRSVRPDGTAENYFGYSGSYTGPGAYGVTTA